MYSICGSTVKPYIMKTSKVLFFSSLLISSLFISCTGEDGEQGIQGEPGDNCWEAPGVTDINNDGKIDISDCIGTNGEDGEAGEDGNANVQKLTWDLSQTPAGESSIPIIVPEFTPEVLQNNTLIAHLEVSDDTDSFYFLLPGRVQAFGQDVAIYYTEEGLLLSLYNPDGTPGNWPDLPEGVSVTLHITMVEISTNAMAGKNSVADNLKNAGVDIANYHEVMEYYGLE